MAVTTNYSLYKPAAHENGVADELNANLDTIDAQLKHAQNHRGNTSNPHAVDKTDVGLGNVLNIAQAAAVHTHSDLVSESELYDLIGALVDISTDSISSRPYIADSIVNGIKLDTTPFYHLSVLLGTVMYLFRYVYAATVPASISDTLRRFCPAGAEITFATPSDDTYKLYLQVKAENTLNRTQTAWSAIFEEDDFGTDVTASSIANELQNSAKYIADSHASLASNPLFAAKVAANMKGYLSGTAVPAMTPDFIGQEYYKTDTKKLYKAFGTASSSDWVIMN